MQLLQKCDTIRLMAAAAILSVILVSIVLAFAVYDMLKAQPSAVRTSEGYVQI